MSKTTKQIERLMAEFKAATGAQLTAHEQRIAAREAKAKRERERYASDPAYRAKKQAAALAWKAANPDKAAKSKRKWNKKHGTAAVQRHRAKKRAEQENAR